VELLNKEVEEFEVFIGIEKVEVGKVVLVEVVEVGEVVVVEEVDRIERVVSKVFLRKKLVKITFKNRNKRDR
jgi:hypothetical protein